MERLKRNSSRSTILQTPTGVEPSPTLPWALAPPFTIPSREAAMREREDILGKIFPDKPRMTERQGKFGLHRHGLLTHEKSGTVGQRLSEMGQSTTNECTRSPLYSILKQPKSIMSIEDGGRDEESRRLCRDCVEIEQLGNGLILVLGWIEVHDVTMPGQGR